MRFNKQKKSGSWSCSHCCDNWYFCLFESLNAKINSTFWLLKGIHYKDNGVGNGFRSIKWKLSHEKNILFWFEIPLKCNHMEKWYAFLYYIISTSCRWEKRKTKASLGWGKNDFGCPSAVATRKRNIFVFRFIGTSFACNYTRNFLKTGLLFV